MLARSFLFVPGNRPERFEKAWNSGADVVILDLEDAVPCEQKQMALESVISWLSPDHPVYVRVNGPETEWFSRDIAYLLKPGVAGVVLPKVEDKGQIVQLVERLPEHLPVIPAIETALGVWNVMDIAKGPQVSRIAFGSVDFQLDTGIRGEGDALLYTRSKLVLASRIAGILPPVDGVTTALDDMALLQSDVHRARDLGFGGKLCIHPKQIADVNKGFMPTEQEVTWARAILIAIKEMGEGAIRLNGQLVDRPVIDRAKKMVELVGC